MAQPNPALRHFSYEHLPAHLQAVSKPFALLARKVLARNPGSRETQKSLDHLLAAKDAAVRAALEK